MKKEEEKLTVRVTVSAYVRSLIDQKRKRASDDECYDCLGRLEQAADKDDCLRHVYEFIREKYHETESGGDA